MVCRLAPVVGLFVLAPFVGEYLLGNLTISALALGLLLAPLYGCGAILVRELARRYGGGWPTMALLACAYALIEEGPVDQLLWNDSYAGADMLTLAGRMARHPAPHNSTHRGVLEHESAGDGHRSRREASAS